MRFLQSSIFSPFALAVQPVVMMFALNVESVSLSDFAIPALAGVLVAAFFGSLAWLLFRNKFKAAGMTSVFMLLFFSFRDISTWVEGRTGVTETASEWLTLFLMLLILLLFGSIGLRIIRNMREMNLYFNVLSVLFLLYSSYILTRNVMETGVWQERLQPSVPPVAADAGDDSLPDIYYIILDGYGSQHALRKYYEFDNGAFIDQLEEMGFYVAAGSNSNYIQTSLSLCSSLNSDYIEDISIGKRPIRKRSHLFNCIRDSRIRRLLAERGYRMVSFQTSYEFVSITDADIFYGNGNRSKFISLVLDVTMARMLRGNGYVRNWLYALPYTEHRRITLDTLDRLQEIPEIDGPLFVFAHVIAPHPPFIFDENGPILEFSAPFTLGDASDYIETHSRQEYLDGYRAQVQYLNGLVIDTISAILERSDPPPILIIQGDHGPGAYLDWESLEGSKLDERFGILDAYYFPDQNYASLYETISPVNSFRAVLNGYFDGKYDLLPDRHYFSTWSRPLKFTEVDLTRMEK